MSDRITKVTTESWGTRLGKAVAGIGIGFVLVIGSIVGLAWNENRAVQTARSLTEGAGADITLDDRGAAYDENGDAVDTGGMLVHASGNVKGPVPTDTAIGGPSMPENATRLVRTVEMYQWEENQRSETRNKLGGGTETVTHYTYSQTWSARPIDSGRFQDPTGHQNPPMLIESDRFEVERNLVVGERTFTIPADRIGTVGTEQPLPVTDEQAGTMANALGTNLAVTNAGETVYFGEDPARPMVGDFRISYQAKTTDTASVVAADAGSAFQPWLSSNGQEIFLIRDGAVSAAEMFDQEQQSNAMLTWMLCLGGIVAMLGGFRMMLGIIGVIGDVVPIIGSLARLATGLVALVLTLILAPLTIGLAWIAVRPLLGGAIIAIGLVLAGGAWMLVRKRARQGEPAQGNEQVAA